MNPQKKLKTYHITYRPDPDNRYNNAKVTYQADSIEEAKSKFYKEFPSQKNADYFEIYSPLSNSQIDRDNKKLRKPQIMMMILLPLLLIATMLYIKMT